MERRSYLAGACGLVSTSVAGCSLSNIGMNSDQHGEKYARENICPTPPVDSDDLSFVWHEPHVSFDNPLVIGGQWDHSTPSEESDAFLLISRRDDSRLNLDALENQPEYSGEDRTFVNETDFDTSVLLAFQHQVEGDQEFGVEAVTREGAATIGTYACLWGNPRPETHDASGEPAIRPMTVFIRVSVSSRPEEASLTFARSRPPPDDSREVERYTAEAKNV